MQSWIRKNPTFCCVLVVAIIFWFFFSRFYTTFSMDTSSVKEGMVHGPNPNPKPEINAPGVAYTPFPDAEPYQARDASIGAAKATAEYERLRLMGQEDNLQDKVDEVEKLKKTASATKKNYQHAKSAQKKMVQKEAKLQKMAKAYKKLEAEPANNQDVQPMSLGDCKKTKHYCVGAYELCRAKAGKSSKSTHCLWNENYCNDTFNKCQPLYGDI